MIYFTSDLHFCHDKPFLYTPRGFSNIDDHDETIIKNWNSIIADEDDVYLLGDLMLNDTEKGLEYIKQLKGKIHIIIGNHDTNTRIALYKTLANVVEVVYATQIEYKNRKFYLSHYPMYANVRETLRYPTQVLYSLHGHTHQNTNFFNDMFFIYHVGLDSHNNCPVSIEQVIEDCNAKFNSQLSK